MFSSRLQTNSISVRQRSWLCCGLIIALLTSLIGGCRRIDTEQNTNINVEFANEKERYLFGLRLIELTLSEAEVPAGRHVRLSATAVYKDGSTKAINDLITLQLSDATLATLLSQSSEELEFVTTAAGTLDLTASFGEFSTTTSVIIGPPTVDILHIFPSVLTVVKGQSTAVSVLASYSDKRVVDVTAEASLTYESDARVGLPGLGSDGRLRIEALEQGESVLTTRFGGQSTTAAITVVSDALASITLSHQILSLKLGDSQQFQALGTTIDGFDFDVTELVRWTSAAPSKADFASQTPGRLITAAPGELTISASYQGITASTTVYVHTPRVSALVLEPATTTNVPLGETLSLQAVMQYHDGTSLDVTSSCQWSSSVPAKADFLTVPGSQHILTGMNEGDTTITASCLGYEGQKNITVSAPIVKSLIITSSTTGIASPLTSLSVPAGRSRHVKVWGIYSDNRSEDLTASATSPAGPTSYNVTSGVDSGVTVLTVAGLLEASTSVTFQAAGVTATIPLIIGEPELVSLALTPATTSIALGRTQQYSVSAVYSDSPLTVALTADAVHWYISYNTTTYALPPAFVNVAEDPGLVQSLKVGVVNVHAELNGISTSATLTITPAVIVDITLTADESLEKGDTTPVTAVLNYSDGTTAPANTACADYDFTFTATKTAGYAATPLTINDDLCLLNIVTAIASQEGVAELELKMEPSSGVGTTITSSTPVEFVIRTPCSNAPTVQAYGTLNSHANMFCWYQGVIGESCTQTCTTAGRTNLADANLHQAGSMGTMAQCKELLPKFAAFSAIDVATYQDSTALGSGIGCGVYEDFGVKQGIREIFTPTAAGDSNVKIYRVCACSP